MNKPRANVRKHVLSNLKSKSCILSKLKIYLLSLQRLFKNIKKWRKVQMNFYKFKQIKYNKKKKCRNPGSNQGPLDLQSNALPTELFRLDERKN